MTSGREYSRSFGDSAVSAFPKMGEHPLEGSLVNTSGERSPYTKTVARKGPAGDSETEGAPVRGHTQISEAQGPTFAPQTTIDFPNAPEASQTGRGMRRVPSSVGNRDFWDDRASQSGKVIVP